ncbi:hypothetical protein E3T46_07700 [Cryobacterium sp. Hh11]|uniref:hypothetical protein n=1 Tax=Cryobacterium sp. Hh11 TaxID=2555868 RepID=UPI00106D9286|nr:hypothetical protein [Cryobacterium sp. Hh11]TFD51964.1 hypothetical protein E3T46_07700 [Cryobacterium sp. Hh11]
MSTEEETLAAEAEATAAAEAAAADDTAGSEALGDAGKKALDSMKAKWREAERIGKASATEFAAYKATAEGREAEHKTDQANQKVRDDALSAANQRILKAEVRAAAATKLADPADALRFLDLSSFEVGEDGEIDAATVASAIDDLIASKPYLAAQGGKRFQGSGDTGTRNESTRPAQLNGEDLKKLSPQQIVAAKNAGQLDDYLKS